MSNINFNNTEVFNIKGALRGMRNPLNSWSKSDSYFSDKIIIGENDKSLIKRLIESGSEHSKFLRQIIVSVDITAPRYFWQEFDTYKFTESNSCSTMHTLLKSELSILDFAEVDKDYEMILYDICQFINMKIKSLNGLSNKDNALRNIKVILPEGFKQTRTLTINYSSLRNMIKQRKHHRLKEWYLFLKWCETLPESWMLF